MVLGRLLAFFAILLQIAVFIQPLLPEKYQVSPICETIVHALQLDTSHHPHNSSNHLSHDHSHQDLGLTEHVYIDQKTSSSHNHDINHQCQYCVVYAHVVPLPDIGVKEVLVRIKVLFLAFKEAFFHIFFLLKQLFLLPQSRAPPLSSAI